MKKNTIIGFIIALCGSCNSDSYYSSNQVIIKNHSIENGEHFVTYSVPLETLYYSSGCDVKYNADSTEIILRFIRQKINTKFSGNLESNIVRDSENNINHIIKFPDKAKKISLKEPYLIIYPK